MDDRAGATKPSNRRSWAYPRALLAIYLVVWTALAVDPRYRADWALENVLPLVALPVLIGCRRRIAFSDRAYTGLFLLFVLHAIGAHYTYAETPYRAWIEAIVGPDPGATPAFARNHFDRIVHFLYGAFLLPATRELVGAVAAPRGAWKWVLPVLLIAAQSAIYELIEWAAVEIFAPELGQAYLGTQGDGWDAHKDMALALLGAAGATAIGLIAGRLDGRG